MPPEHDPLSEFLAHIRAHQAREAASVQPFHSFWYHRPAKQFPPATITTPSQYDGSDRLSVQCTQTSLPAAAQRKLVAEWCEVLPTLREVQFLWFPSKVLPAMFEAACRMPNLAGLYIKWSGIKSLEPLRGLADLKYLRIGSSPGIATLEPLPALTGLRWLELENLKLVTNLDPLATLTELKGFAFDGGDGGRHVVDSWEPIGHLRNLVWLKLGAVQSRDQSLRPLAQLKSLKWLGLARHYPMEEFAHLASQLPLTDCGWFHPFEDLANLGIRCKKCREAHLVMLTGKGKPSLCPACDREALQQHVMQFERLARCS